MFQMERAPVKSPSNINGSVVKLMNSITSEVSLWDRPCY